MEKEIKIKDNISPVLKKITANLARANKLLEENKTLLAKVIQGSLEIV